MNGQISPPIRMIFEMSREEHPQLYDDLIRFPKGTKRINRLRTLAPDGLLFQSGVLGRVMDELDGVGKRPEGKVLSGVTNQIFEEPLQE